MKQLGELQSQYGNFEVFDTENENAVRACKRAVASLVDAANSEEDARQLARAFRGFLCESDVFQPLDYYILWRGSEVLVSDAPHQMALIFALARKIDNRDDVQGCDIEVLTEMCVMAMEIITSLVDGAPTMVGRDMKVVWSEWRRFSADLSAFRGGIQFDFGRRKFILNRLSP